MSNALSVLDRLITRAVEVFERLWPLIKGAPHNRLAWLVVAAGVFVVSGPVWDPYARALVSKVFDVKIDDPPHPGWGLALVAVGLAYHLLAYRADALRKELAEKRVRDHDGPLVREFQTSFSEDRMQSILSLLRGDHSIMTSELLFLDRLVERLASADFHLLDPTLREKAASLRSCVIKLNRFVGSQFFVPVAATSPNRVCLRPDWNIDRSARRHPTAEERARYDELEQELDEVARSVATAYVEIIRTAHERVL